MILSGIGQKGKLIGNKIKKDVELMSLKGRCTKDLQIVHGYFEEKAVLGISFSGIIMCWAQISLYAS